MSQYFGSSSKVDSRVISHLESWIAKANVFVVSKIRCGACIQAKDLFNKLAPKTGVLPTVFELDKYSKQQVKMIIAHLSAKTSIKTVPQIWINGKFIGGNDDIHRIHREGRLVSLISGKSGSGRTMSKRNVPSHYFARAKVVFPSKSKVLSKSSILEDRSVHIESSRNELWYLPSTFTVDDESKYDLPVQKSQSEKLGNLAQLLPLQKSNSLSLGSSFPNSTRSVGSSWSSSTSSRSNKSPQAQSTKLSMPRLKEVDDEKSYWLADEAILNRPAVVKHLPRSRGKDITRRVIVSAVI